MTPPPPALPRLQTGNREMRRRAPVSDHPDAGLIAAGSSLPPQGVVLSAVSAVSAGLPPAQFFAGLDWAAEVHAVCVMDHAGKIVDRFTIAHTADGIALLIRRLGKLAEPGDVQVGIERPNGRLVDLLLEAGHPVVPVSPNAIKAWRDGEVLSGAKSDAGDAAVIAEYLRLRAHRLRVVPGYSPETKA